VSQSGNQVTIRWDGSAGTQFVSVAVTQGNCTTTKSLNVTVLPIVGITGNTTVCPNSTETYSATATGTYLWSVSGGTITGSNSQQSVTVNWGNTTTAGTLTLVFTSPSPQSCMATFVVPISIQQFTPVITGASGLCLFQTTSFSSSTAGVNYTWRVGGGTLASSQVLSSMVITFDRAGIDTVYLSVTTANGCTATSFHTVQVTNQPSTNITTVNDTVCFGDDGRILVNNTESNVTYVLINSQSALVDSKVGNGGQIQLTVPPQFMPTVPGSNRYFLSGDRNGCSINFSNTIFIQVNIRPIASYVVTDPVPAEVSLPDAQITFDATASANSSFFEWEFGDGQTGTGATVTHTYSTTGTYNPVLTVFNSNRSCSDALQSTTVYVYEHDHFFVPNIFSPNGDGQYDLFKIKAFDAQSVAFKIYNRWGELIWQTDNSSFEWNGNTSNGEVCPEGVYVYVAKLVFTDGTQAQKKGTVTLIR